MIGYWTAMQRGEARLPPWARRLPAAMLSLLAQRRRQRGFYDPCTLALFRRAWCRGRAPSALIDYVLFRRDLGIRVADNVIAQLRRALPHLRPRRRRLALALLAEVGCESGDRSEWADAALGTILGQQARWRAAFADVMRRCAQQGICIVGNAAWLNGAGCGARIDSHGAVVRFNRCHGDSGHESDFGRKHDVWVVSPAYAGALTAAVDWIVVSGPDMCFRRADWSNLSRPLAGGAAILTIPLEAWRGLVAQLQAPPSAGLLFLAWLRELLGSWDGIYAVGFGGTVGAGQRYHHADARHRAASRHNWEGERRLLQQWIGQGLNVEPIR